MITLLILLLVTLLILASWIHLINDCKKFNFSGPRPIPVLGNGHLFIGKQSQFLRILGQIRKKYGHVYLVHLFHSAYVVFSHPKYIEALVSHAELITKGRSYNYIRPWLGNGLLTSTGTRWRLTRKFLTPAFHFNILQNFLPVFLKNEKILIKKLQNYADGKPFSVFSTIALTALDNVTESIMGVSIDAQKNTKSKYVKAIHEIAKIITLRMQNVFVGEDAIFNLLPYKKKQDEVLDILHSQTRKVIEARREELQNANITSLNANSDSGIRNKQAFLDLLLLAEADGKKVDDDHVREEVDTFMFEGHDTVTSGITFTLYCLSKHLDIQEKIIEEQKSIFGENMDQDPQYSDLKRMKYLEQVIKEGLRIYPSVPLIERLITKDIEIAGLKIKKNTSVVVNIFDMQRHPDFYDNPMEFRPERFDPVLSPQTAKNAFTWLAFSAGPRNCIGQKFAMMEMKVTIASIIKNFVVLPSKFEEEPLLCAELILRPRDEVTLRLKPREKKY
ncbi:unnamed protein product, partial [Brenthis ino]